VCIFVFFDFARLSFRLLIPRLDPCGGGGGGGSRLLLGPYFLAFMKENTALEDNDS
jgi:hypothetical protein